MGSNPTKSQQLQHNFPDYKILPELSLHPTNIYQLIYVSKHPTNQIYLIKQCTKQNTSLHQVNHNHWCYQNVITTGKKKQIDNMCYTLYQWIPLTLERYIESYPGNANRGFAVFVVQTLVRVYGALWNLCNGVGLDITCDNVRAGKNGNGKLCIKVYPPQLTLCSFPHKKAVYRNQIKDLGQTLYQIFKNKQREVGQDVMNFILHRIKANNTQTNLTNWQILQRDCQTLNQPHQNNHISVQELNQFKYSRTPQKLQTRPVSHVAYDQNQNRRQIVQIVNEKSTSPFHNARISNVRDNSPMVSKVQYDAVRPITQNISYNTAPKTPSVFYNEPRPQVSSISPAKLNDTINYQARTSFIPNNEQQHRQKQNVKGGIKVTHQIYQPITRHQNVQITNTRNQSPIQLRSNRNIVEQQQGLRQNKLSPSPMRYYHIESSQISNNSNFKPNQNLNVVTSNFYSTPVMREGPQPMSTTPRQRNFNINDHKNLPENKNLSEVKVSANPNIRLQQQNQPNPNQTFPRPSLPQKPQTRFETPLSLPPLFSPSPRDPLQIRPRIGVPNPVYTQKTHEDRHDIEQRNSIKNYSQQSLNLQASGEDFMQKHLMIKNKDKQLFGSSIPVIHVDKSSQFALAFSDESIQANFDGIYDGVYEGSFHPNHPNVRHGVGRLVLPSGGSYQGGFAWNKMQGWGKLFYPSGRLMYQGYWKNSKYEGYGKLFNQKPLHIQTFNCQDFTKIQSNNDEGYWKYYQGNLKNDLKQGHGVLVLENGQKYDGQFYQDMVHGYGTFYGKKECVEGRWDKNVLVEIVKVV